MAHDPPGRERPLGTAEKTALLALLNRGGTWSKGDKPLWESAYWTIELLCGLIRKGMATEVAIGKQYELSEQGLRKAAQLHMEACSAKNQRR